VLADYCLNDPYVAGVRVDFHLDRPGTPRSARAGEFSVYIAMLRKPSANQQALVVSALGLMRGPGLPLRTLGHRLDQSDRPGVFHEAQPKLHRISVLRRSQLVHE